MAITNADLLDKVDYLALFGIVKAILDNISSMQNRATDTNRRSSKQIKRQSKIFYRLNILLREQDLYLMS